MPLPHDAPRVVALTAVGEGGQVATSRSKSKTVFFGLLVLGCWRLPLPNFVKYLQPVSALGELERQSVFGGTTLSLVLVHWAFCAKSIRGIGLCNQAPTKRSPCCQTASLFTSTHHSPYSVDLSLLSLRRLLHSA